MSDPSSTGERCQETRQGGPQPSRDQASALEHLKQSLKEVSEEPGATVHYPPGTTATDAGLSSLDPTGTGAEGRKLFTAPNPQGGVDVVECIDVAKAQELGGEAAGGGGSSSADDVEVQQRVSDYARLAGVSEDVIHMLTGQ